MRKLRKWRWLGLGLFVLAGCHSTDAEVKPKYQPESYTLPPANDTRYDTNMTYPKDTLFQDVIKRDTPGSSDQMKSPSHFGGSGGMSPTGY